jgi:hypothetical protein
LLGRRGAVPAAREHFERALEILERLGTLREPERVRGDLARLGTP